MKTSSPGYATRTWKMMRTEPRPLRSRMGESAPGQGQGFWAHVCPQLAVVLQHHQQQHTALLQRLLQLDPTSFDPEKPPGSAGLLPASAVGARCLQCHLLCAGHPAVSPRSLPCDLHLLRCQGPPGLPILLPALL
uniref:Uncharacterized protein n=1 Tax=Mus musculus TaxID=10090 RepID=Q9D840_MOUSE|nr:unnamed protein product [Mus musculus]